MISTVAFPPQPSQFSVGRSQEARSPCAGNGSFPVSKTIQDKPNDLAIALPSSGEAARLWITAPGLVGYPQFP
ncbi:MAG: hypothetical protein L0K96_11120, partial [Corynebacterium flavescens]|uniref:hypothetical protein n=1 Tax=Corynebacterium flavescens TaxID=28028 RepID=UPI00264792E7